MINRSVVAPSATRTARAPAVTRITEPVAASRPREPARRVSDVKIALQRVALGSGKQPVAATEVVPRFLSDMAAAAERTFPEWRERLVPAIEECCTSYDTRRALLEVHPLEDYYLAGVVALEAAKIRHLLPPEVRNELLSLIGEQVSQVADRTDRVVPELVFSIIGSISLDSGVDKLRRDYDQVSKAILHRMGVDACDATKHLMRDFYYRHNLGEPLARGVPQWWKTFAAKYMIVAPKRTRAASGA